MKFILWQQDLVRESIDSTWMLRFDREVLIEGPSKEWCEIMFNGIIDISPVCKLLSINVMPYDEWKAWIDKWAETDLLAASDALNQINERGFVNYPATSPTPWSPYWHGKRARAPVV